MDPEVMTWTHENEEENLILTYYTELGPTGFNNIYNITEC